MSRRPLRSARNPWPMRRASPPRLRAPRTSRSSSSSHSGSPPRKMRQSASRVYGRSSARGGSVLSPPAGPYGSSGSRASETVGADVAESQRTIQCSHAGLTLRAQSPAPAPFTAPRRAPQVADLRPAADGQVEPVPVEPGEPDAGQLPGHEAVPRHDRGQLRGLHEPAPLVDDGARVGDAQAPVL